MWHTSPRSHFPILKTNQSNCHHYYLALDLGSGERINLICKIHHSISIMKFLVLTQDDGVAPASITAQTSAARSYLATQRHAHRRSLKTSATREQHEVTWRRDTVSTTSYVDLPSVEPYPAPSTRQPALSTRMRLPRRSSTKSKTELPYEDAFDPFISSIRDTHDSLQPTSEYTSPEADHDSVNLRPDTSTEVDASFPGPSDHLSPINFQQRSPRFFLPHSIISTITASLDPFLHLPLKITAQEESVLHFCKTHDQYFSK